MIVVGCGTKSGNPSSAVVLNDSALLATFINSAADTVVSNSTAGTDLLSANTKSIALEPQCQDSPMSFNLRGSSQHSQNRSQDNYSFDSDLSINKSIESQISSDIASCDVASVLAASKREQGVAMSQSIVYRRERKLDFAVTTGSGGTVDINHSSLASRVSSLNLTIMTTAENSVEIASSGTSRVDLSTQSSEGESSDFTYSTSSSGAKPFNSSYNLVDGQPANVNINGDQVFFQLEEGYGIRFDSYALQFDDVVGCFPSSGAITGTIETPESSQAFELVLSTDEPSHFLIIDSGVKIAFLPQSCELDER